MTEFPASAVRPAAKDSSIKQFKRKMNVAVNVYPHLGREAFGPSIGVSGRRFREALRCQWRVFINYNPSCTIHQFQKKRISLLDTCNVRCRGLKSEMQLLSNSRLRLFQPRYLIVLN